MWRGPWREFHKRFSYPSSSLYTDSTLALGLCVRSLWRTLVPPSPGPRQRNITVTSTQGGRNANICVSCGHLCPPPFPLVDLAVCNCFLVFNLDIKDHPGQGQLCRPDDCMACVCVLVRHCCTDAGPYQKTNCIFSKKQDQRVWGLAGLLRVDFLESLVTRH